MKTFIVWSHVLLFSLSLAAQNQTTVITTLNDPCTNSAFQVYPNTVQMWQESWKWAHDLTASDPVITYTFTQQKVQELKNKFPITSGLRMYYGLKDSTDTIPILLLVNISSCKDQLKVNDATVLMNNATGGQFITTGEAALMTSYWRAHCVQKQPTYTPVYAYNYRWDLIEQLQQLPSNPSAEIKVTFGLRSIEPGDAYFDPQGVTHKGSIVYVNILFAASALNQVQHNFDFTMPCPQKCDAVSPLMNAPIN